MKRNVVLGIIGGTVLVAGVARRGILDFYPVVFRLSRSFLDSFLGFFTPISWLSKFKYIVFKSSRF